jgi:hypothetical protein
VLAGASIGTETLSVKHLESKEDDQDVPDADSELRAKALREFVRFERTRNRLLMHGGI